MIGMCYLMIYLFRAYKTDFIEELLHGVDDILLHVEFIMGHVFRK